MAVYNIALDTVSRRTVPVQIPVRAGDTHSRTIKCVITRAGETLGEGYSVRFECAKPDNTFVRDSEVTFDGTVATYTLANEVLATPGVIELAYFALLKDGNVVETTESFTLLIDSNAESAAGESTKPYISQIDALISSVEEAGTELLRLNEQIAPIEAARQEAEDTRKAQETARQSAESAREAAEHTRTSAEDTRLTAERTRDEAERIRRDAENARGEAERTRTSAEESRVNAERTRTNNETERQNQEQERARAEQARISAESERVSAEGIRKTQETARQSAESARAENETLRTQAESTRGTQEAARESAESMRVAAEQARAEAESARTEAEQTRASAETTRTEQQAKNNADQAANNAAAQGLLMRVLGEGEYNPQTGEPTISGETGKMYLVPVSASGDNKYAEWLWIDGVFEKIGMTGATVDPITTDDIDEVAQGTDKQGTGVLNTTGLTYLWTKLKGAFAARLHSHDASDITSGTLSPDRLNMLSSDNAREIARMHPDANSTDEYEEDEDGRIYPYSGQPSTTATSNKTVVGADALSEAIAETKRQITGGNVDINAGSIKSGTLHIDRLPSIPSYKLSGLDTSKIVSGTISVDRLPNIPASKITDLPQPDLTHLDAGNITSGTLSPERLPMLDADFARQIGTGASIADNSDIVGGHSLEMALDGFLDTLEVGAASIPASSIRSGTLSVDRLPSIPASKVTGQVTTSQVPNLDASKIASGTLSVDRLPAIPASKVTGLNSINKSATFGDITAVRRGDIVWLHGYFSSSKTIIIDDTDFFPAIKDTLRFAVPCLFDGYTKGTICRIVPSTSSIEISFYRSIGEYGNVNGGKVSLDITYIAQGD